MEMKEELSERVRNDIPLGMDSGKDRSFLDS